MKSIMQDTKECYYTGSTTGLHKHHVFGGKKNRSKSEKYGCWVWLRHDWHNTSNYGVHFNPPLKEALQKDTQMKFESIWGHEKFMAVFKKNYL